MLQYSLQSVFHFESILAVDFFTNYIPINIVVAYLGSLRAIWKIVINWYDYCYVYLIDSRGESELKLCEKESQTWKMNIK